MALLEYTHAIVCRIPNSFKTSLSVKNDINLDEARKQYETYCGILEELDIDVIELEANESLPNCPFVEDIAIICNGIALICKPSLSLRQKEIEQIKRIFEKKLKIPVLEIADKGAKLEGGDVLFTGREFFVGLSSWTNDSGAQSVAAAFPEYPVTPVKVPGKYHLKSLISMAGPDIICVSNSSESQSIVSRMGREATFKYKTVTVPDLSAGSCLYANGTLIHLSQFPDSAMIIDTKLGNYRRKAFRFTEIVKVGGHLSRCCILFKKSNCIKNL